MHYIEPSFQFLIGVWVFREPFSLGRLVGFAIVWAAIILYSFEGIFVRRRQQHLPEIVEGQEVGPPSS